jgi:hypothetical protein
MIPLIWFYLLRFGFNSSYRCNGLYIYKVKKTKEAPVPNPQLDELRRKAEKECNQ